MERLGEKYQVDELAAKYDFTGQTPMSVEQALAIKEELENPHYKATSNNQGAPNVLRIGLEGLGKFTRKLINNSFLHKN